MRSTTTGNENQNCFQNSNENRVQTVYFGITLPSLERIAELFENERRYYTLVKLLKKVDMWDSIVLVLACPEKYSIDEIKEMNYEKKKSA